MNWRSPSDLHQKGSESDNATEPLIPALKRGHYDIATDAPVHHRLLTAFDELALAI